MNAPNTDHPSSPNTSSHTTMSSQTRQEQAQKHVQGMAVLLGLSPAAWGALLAMLAIILGAFGAHALENTLSPARLDTFEVAVRYQMYHALALLALSALPQRLWRVAPWWLYGSFIFSGSLYVLVLTDTGILGAITPIGGVLQIIGWGWLFILLIKRSPEASEVL